MKKLIIVLILFFGLFLSGCINNKTAYSVSTTPSSINESQPSQPIFNPIYDSRDGIDVTVENVKKENGKTIIELTLSNHRYNLLVFDPKSWSNFSGVKPSEYIITSSEMGGHHIQAEIIFGEELFGPLTIGLDDFLVFNFNIP